MDVQIQKVISFIRSVFNSDQPIPLHVPFFGGNEKKYLIECIDSTFVSSVGPFVTKFEHQIATYSGTKYGVAVVNGTAAIHVALHALGVENNDEVLTQGLTFVATANAISYCKAHPVFIDVDRDTMGLSPIALLKFLEENAEIVNGKCINRLTKRRIVACVPMHTFGFPCRIEEICSICKKWNISVIEDAAEALGSSYKGKRLGTFGELGVFSFNGNKVVTAGGGGAIITNNQRLAMRVKHLTTTAKLAHNYEFCHDELGFNYRMPNINAALLCAQMEQLDEFLENKRDLASMYERFFRESSFVFRSENIESEANYWLMCLELENKRTRDLFLEKTNDANVMTRPIWQLMFRLPMYQACQKDDQANAIYLEQRIVNIPSSYRNNGA